MNLSFVTMLKRYIPEKLVHNKNYIAFVVKNYYKLKMSKKRLFLMNTPVHGNIGDQAISIAEKKWLKDNCSQYEVIEVDNPLLRHSFNQVIKLVKDEIVLIHGGGYLGTIWIEEENMLRRIIESIPNNRLIVMPQTVFYEKTQFGVEELKKSKEIYNSHRDLHFCARDRMTYQYLSENFMSNVILTPDIVMYLDESHSVKYRSGILMCMRSDKESVQKGTVTSRINSVLAKYSDEVKYTDTVINDSVKARNRRRVFESKIYEFATSRVVVTDRLHGMIFSAITATPCIAFNNVSGKVKGVYEWLKHLDYIVFIDNDDDLEKQLDLMFKKKDMKYTQDPFLLEYEQIKKLILSYED